MTTEPAGDVAAQDMITANKVLLRLFERPSLYAIDALARALAAARAQGEATERERILLRIKAWTVKSCRHHDDDPCCHVRTAQGIIAALRATPEATP